MFWGISIISLIGTIVVYWMCKKLYVKLHISLLTPILTSVLFIICLISLFHVPYSQYVMGSKPLLDLLGPATVAFAVPLYKNVGTLKKYAFEIVTGVCFGSIVAFISSFKFANWAHLGDQIAFSMAPRSVTTPIAIDISNVIGGIPVMTAAFVILTGVTGVIVGPLVIRTFRIHSSVAKGLLLGTGAHGAGTSRAFEYGESEGTFASISMITASLSMLVIAPLLTTWLAR